MTRTVTSCMFAMVLCVTVTCAHHSMAGEYDATRQLPVEGFVNVFRFVNPHPFVEMGVADRAGWTQHWRLEMDNRGKLAPLVRPRPRSCSREMLCTETGLSKQFTRRRRSGGLDPIAWTRSERRIRCSDKLYNSSYNLRL